MVNFSELFTGLGDLGTELGAFLTNITPGIVVLVATLTVVGAIVGIILGVAYLIKKKIKV